MIAGERAIAARFEPDFVNLRTPGSRSLLLLVDNVGNLEEELTATITATTGPLTAALNDLNGQPAQTVPLFLLPGLSSGAILVDTQLTEFGTGTITVLVSSLLDDTVTAEATATITSDAPVLFDFGDAPTSYGTLLADDGARHEQEGPKLGTEWDAESDAAAPLDGSGDDGSNTGSQDDEDGVTISEDFTLTVGQTATATVHISGVAERTARLFAWVDFNGNGSFDASEQISDGSELLTYGHHVITFAVPDTGFIGTTYARFRATSELELGPTGPAVDGEVEDYVVNVAEAAEGNSSIFGTSYIDTNNNGQLDPIETRLLGTRILLTEPDGEVIATTFSNGNGLFRFADLEPGTYVVQKEQPVLYFDGRDTAGTLGDADRVEDQFTINLPATTDATAYLFAERGLLPQFIGKSLFLASTDHHRFDNVSLAVTNRWHSFVAEGEELELKLRFNPVRGDVSVQLFDESMQEVQDTLAADGVIRWPVISGDTYQVRLSGTNDQVSIAMTFSDRSQSAAAESTDAPVGASPRFLPDLDGDGRVALADFLRLAANFGKTDAVWEEGDLDRDQSVTMEDFLILAAHFGEQRPVAEQVAVLHDPFSVAEGVDDFFSQHLDESIVGDGFTGV